MISELVIGASAPSLGQLNYLQGKPIDEFRRGSTYVVCIWATWCGWCKSSLVHLEHLHAQFPEATIVAIAIMNERATDIASYVHSIRPSITYAIARDLDEDYRPDVSSPSWIREAWLHAASLRTIPTAFLVEKGGRIAWFGSPMEIDGPLEAVLRSDWSMDLAITSDNASREQAEKREVFRLRKAVEEQFANSAYAAALDTIDNAVRHSAHLADSPVVQMLRLEALVAQDRSEDAVRYFECRFERSTDLGYLVSMTLRLFKRQPMSRDLARAGLLAVSVLEERGVESYPPDVQVQLWYVRVLGYAALDHIGDARRAAERMRQIAEDPSIDQRTRTMFYDAVEGTIGTT